MPTALAYKEPPELSEYEKERGKPMPSANHAAVQAYLTAALLRFDDDYSIFSELSLELDGQAFVPDICVYPRLHLDLRRDEVKMTEPPILTVEILLPSQSLDELIHKADAYLAAGVRMCWIVQPILEAVAVMVPGDRVRIHTGGEIQVPETGISVRVEDVFRRFH